MNKSVLALLIVGILAMGLVNATGILYDLSNTWTDYNVTTGSSTGGNTQSTVHVANIGNLVYTSNPLAINVYNISNNVWSAYKRCTSLTGGGALASTNDLLFTASVCNGVNSTIFGMINTTTGVVTDLSTTDPGNWAATTTISDIAIKDNLVFTGMASGKFGYYNYSNNIWTDLSTTDTGNWVGTTIVNSLTIYDNLVYTGLQSGKFGVYNISSSIWTDLSSTDPLNWVGSSAQISLTIDNSTGKVYTTGSPSVFSIGIYDPSTNIWTQKITTLIIPNAVVYDNNRVYITGTGQSVAGSIPLAYYDIINDSFNRISDVGLWSVNSQGSTTGIIVNNNIYFGLTFSGFGVYKFNATEAWQASPYNCINGTRLIEYTDLNNIGTTYDLPIDNGTTRTCSNIIQTSGCALLRQSYTNTIFNLTLNTLPTLAACFQPLSMLASGSSASNQTFKNIIFTCEGRTLTASTSGVTQNRNGFDWTGSTIVNIDNVTINNCTFNNWLYAIRMTRMNLSNGLTFNNLSFTRGLNSTAVTRDILATNLFGSGTVSATNIFHRINATDTSSPYILILGTSAIPVGGILPSDTVNIFVENVSASTKGSIQILSGVNSLGNFTVSNILLQNSYSAAQNSGSGILDILSYSGVTTIVKNVNIVNATNSALSYQGGICFQNVSINLDKINATYNATSPIVDNTAIPALGTTALRSCSFNNTGWWPKIDGPLHYVSLLQTDMGYYNGTNGYDYGWTVNNSLLYFPDNQTSGIGCIPNWVQSKTDCSLGYQLTTYNDSNTCGTLDSLPTNNGTYNYCEINTSTFDRCGYITTPGNYTLIADINQSLNLINSEYMFAPIQLPCIFINSSNVNIDLNNHSITNAFYDTLYSGLLYLYISINPLNTVENITITNGIIIGNSVYDAGMSTYFPSGLHVENITFRGRLNDVIRSNSGSSNQTYNMLFRNILIDGVIQPSGASNIITLNAAPLLQSGQQLINLTFDNFIIQNSIVGRMFTLPATQGNMNNFTIINTSLIASGNTAYAFYGNWTLINNQFDMPINGVGTVGGFAFVGNPTLYSTYVKLINNTFFYNYANFTNMSVALLSMSNTAFIDNESSGNLGWLLLPNMTSGIAASPNTASMSPILAYYNYTQGGYNKSGTYHPDWNTYYNNQGFNPIYPDCNGTIDVLPCAINNTVLNINTTNTIVNFTTMNGTIYFGDIIISDTSIYVSSSSIASVPAYITFNNISNSTYIPYKDGFPCNATYCTNIYKNDTLLSFNVSGFSTYSYGKVPSTVGDNYTQLYTFDNSTVSFGLSQIGTANNGSIVVVPGFWSKNYGKNWTSYISTSPVNLSRTGTTIYVHPDNSFWLIASSTSGSEIYRTTNNGTTWTNVTSGLSSYNWYRFKCNNVGVCLATTVNFYNQVYRSNNSGINWYLAANSSLGLGLPWGLYLSDTNESLLGTYGNNINVSINGAIQYANNSMNYITTNAPSSTISYYRDIVCNNNMSLCYAAADGQPQYGLYYSTNKTGWIADTRAGSFGQKYGIIATTDYSVLTLGPTSGQLQTSHDNGPFNTASSGSYDNVTDGWPWRGMAISQDGHYAYAMGANTIFRSTDNLLDPCNTNWVIVQQSCNNISNYTLTYTDTNMCGNDTLPTPSIPSDNGTIIQCRNLVAGAWNDLSYTDLSNWTASTSINELLTNNNTIYAALNLGEFGIYNATSNLLLNYSPSFLNANNTRSITYDSVNQVIYIGGNSGRFGRYNITSNTWTDLSHDFPFWTCNVVNCQGVYGLIFDTTHNLVYTGLEGGKFGVYNISNNTWTDLSTTDIGNWVGFTSTVKALDYDATHDLIYTGIYNGKLGVYNSTDNTWYDLSTTDTGDWVGTVDNVFSVSYDSINNKLYTGINNGKFGVYDPITNIWTDLRNTSVGNWSGNTSVNRVDVDIINRLVYTSLNSGMLGVYDINTSIWTDLSNTDLGNWSDGNIFALNYDSINNLVYTGSSTGKFGVYMPTCVENWVQDNFTCYGYANYTITYTDTNMCGTNNTLPVDNGTIISCPVLYPNMTNFDGATSNVSNLTFQQITNYSGFILENTSNGKIEWNNNISVYASDFDTNIQILPNLVSVNSTALNPTINTSTNISLYNIFIASPWVFKDGVYCPTCTILSNNGSTIKFYAPSFSNYTLGNCSESWVQQPPMTCNGTNPDYTIIYADTNTCGTTYNLPANNGTVITCVLISYSSGTTSGYTTSTSNSVNVSTNANYTIIRVYNSTGGEIANNLYTSNYSNATYGETGLFDPAHPATYGHDGNYSTYAQPNATGYATIYTNDTIPYFATRLSPWNLITYSNFGPGIDVNVTIPDDCWTYPTLQKAVEMYNDVGIHYVYPQCYNGTAWKILTIDQDSNHSGLYEEPMIWILANGTDYTNTNMTEGIFYYNATGYPQSGQPVSAATQNFTIITHFHNESYNVTFPYPENYKLNSHNLVVPFNTNDTYYNYTIYHVQGISNLSYNFNYTTNAQTYTYVLPDGQYYYSMTIFDKAGNSQLYDPNITIDTTPPIITYLANTQADNAYVGFNKTNATVNISVIDTYLNTTTIWLYKGGIVVDSYSLYNTTLMNKTFIGLTNGVYKFNVTATDDANNTGIAATRTFTIIDTFQTGLYTVTYNYPNDYVSNNSTNNLINFTTTDPYYAYAIYNVSGVLTNTTAQGFTPTLTEGVYNYNVRIYDLAGNSYQYPTQNITVDGTPPVITYIGATEADNSYIGFNRTNITVNIQVTDLHLNSSTNTIYLYDNANNLLSQANNTNLTTFTGLTAGVYKFNASSTDTFNNTGNSVTRTVTIVPFFNTSAYTVNFVHINDTITTATFNAVNFTTTDPYYNQVTYGLSQIPSGFTASETTTRQFKNYTVPSDGTYRNFLTIFDLAGNSQLYEQNITVSAGIPTLAYAADTDNDNSYKNQPYIFVHILPNATNATNLTTIITLYNSTFGIISTANNTNTSNFTGLTDGVYHFNAVASNNGYNTTALTRTVTIHTSFSSGLYNVTFPTPNATLIGTSTFNATVFSTTDPYYAYAVYSISGNVYPFGTYADSTNTTIKFKSWTSPDSDGYFQYGVTIYDLAGNSLFYGPRMIDIDTLPPQYTYGIWTEANNSYIPFRPLYSNPGLPWIGQDVYIYDAHPNDGQTELSLYNSVGAQIADVWGTFAPQHQTVFYGYDATPTVLNLTTGSYHFNGHITDALGHITLLETRYVTIITAFNTTAYTLTFPNANNSYIKVNSFIAANFTTVDPYYSTTTYTIQGLTNLSYGYNVTTANKTYTFTNVPDGRYYYSVNVTDLAGNYHYYDPNITIDTTLPTINFTNNSDGNYVYQRPYLYLETNTTDTNINYTTIYVYNSTGGLVTNFTGNTSITTFTTANLTDAFYYVNATAVDLAGNNASTATFQIELDYIKNGVQFRAAEKVTDNQVTYNITFNSTGNNFQQSSPGLSKSTTVNGIPWNIYNITITATTINNTYYTCNYYNWNATNNYNFGNCALYNSLDYINLTHSYLGTNITNYNVTIVNTANAFVEIDSNVSNYSIGLVKGLNYTLYFDQQSFLSKNITYTPVNTSEIINTALNQTIITLVFKSAFSGSVLNGTNITINDTVVPGKIFSTNTGNITFNPNSGLKNFTMQASGDIIAQPVTLTFTDKQIATIDVLLFPILNISFYDERLSLLNQTFFNFSHTTEAKYTLYCYYPQNFTISGTISNSTTGPLNIPTPCIFDRIRFDLLFTNIDASTFSYYRTITFAPTTTNFAFPVYLVDHTSTDTVETALKPYDIFGIYTVDEHTQIQIKETFPSGTQLVTSDYMDSEGKVTVTLMTAGQYIITVLADNAPIRTLGPYYADSAGTKILRLFDITLTGPANEQPEIVAQTQILDNDSIQMHFADATATTQALTLKIFDVGCDSPLLPSKVPIMQEIYTANQLITANYQVYMTYNVNGTRYMNKTSNKVYCTTYNRTDTSNRIQTTGVTAVYDSKKRLPAQFDSAWTLPWIIMLVLAVFALGANARTAAPVSLLISFLAFLLYGWQWWGTGVTGALPSVALGLTIVLAIFFNFKRVS